LLAGINSATRDTRADVPAAQQPTAEPIVVALVGMHFRRTPATLAEERRIASEMQEAGIGCAQRIDIAPRSR